MTHNEKIGIGGGLVAAAGGLVLGLWPLTGGGLLVALVSALTVVVRSVAGRGKAEPGAFER